MQVSSGGPEPETIFKICAAVVTLLTGGYAIERRLRTWTEATFLTKETANARYESINQDLEETYSKLDKLTKDCMQNTIALGQMGVLQKELSSLKELEREHHDSNVKAAILTRSEILAAIESKFGSILEELRRMRH